MKLVFRGNRRIADAFSCKEEAGYVSENAARLALSAAYAINVSKNVQTHSWRLQKILSPT